MNLQLFAEVQTTGATDLSAEMKTFPGACRFIVATAVLASCNRR